MELWKKELRGLSEPAEVFDLPAELLTRTPHVEVSGNRQLYMENHRGILSYSEEEIAVNGDGMVIEIRGTGLALESMTGDALRIAGTIHSVSWVV